MTASREAILTRLEVSRRELLDLGGRNRLINTPRSSARSSRLEIVDELSDEVFRRLAVDRRAMTFLPGLGLGAEGEAADDPVGVALPQTPSEPPRVEFEAEPDDWASSIDLGSSSEAAALPQPEDEDDEPAARHTDNHLQTALVDDKLQKRLLKLYYDARTYEEEQGVNILFLALGFLKWFDRQESSSRERFAPLILLPVTLEPRS